MQRGFSSPVSGMLITFEGPDGSGKSTQIALLESYLAQQGFITFRTREPGGTAIGEWLRHIVQDRLHQEVDDRTEILLFAASRAQLVAEKIRPEIDPEKGLRRRLKDQQAEWNRLDGLALEFHQRVHEGYQKLIAVEPGGGGWSSTASSLLNRCRRSSVPRLWNGWCAMPPHKQGWARGRSRHRPAMALNSQLTPGFRQLQGDLPFPRSQTRYLHRLSRRLPA